MNCDICNDTGFVSMPDRFSKWTVSEPCPCGKHQRDLEESIRARLAAGEPWYGILGMKPAGHSILHPRQREADGGARHCQGQT